MYATLSGRPRSLGQTTTAVGAAAGTAVAGPIGTVVGGLLGSLFGGGSSNPTVTGQVQTPKGYLTITFSGAGSITQSAQYIFYTWAQAGQVAGQNALAALTSIANTGTGPKWDNPTQTYSGYGSTDRAFAGQLVAAYTAAQGTAAQPAAYNPTGTTTAQATALNLSTLSSIISGTPLPASVPGGSVLPVAPSPATASILGLSPTTALLLGVGGFLVYKMTSGPKRSRNPRRRRAHRRRRR